MNIEKISQQLLSAEIDCVPVQPLTDTYPELCVEDAYAIQQRTISTFCEQGKRVIGKKIGITSRGMQRLLNVEKPDFGHLLDDMLISEGDPCRVRDLIAPKVEGEIAFVLNKRLQGPGLTIADVYRATEFILPAIEVVDSRIVDWKIKLMDTIADNASSGRFVIGSHMTKIADVDLRLIGMLIQKNGELVNSGVGAEVLGNPARAVAWLGNQLSVLELSLEPGEIILSGAVTAAIPAKKGDVFSVSFDRLGNLNLLFN